MLVDDAEAGIHVQNKPCQRLYKEWKKKPSHKAFAVSQSIGVGMQGCGAAWGAPSKAIAEGNAIKSCRQAKAMAATCAVMESQ
jgi:hypothetical protein